MTVISTETLAKVAATLTAAMIEQDCLDNPKIRDGGFLLKHATVTFGEVLDELERTHGVGKGGQLFETKG